MALRVAAFDLDGVLALPSIAGAFRRSEEALALPRDFLLGAYQTEFPEGPTEQLMKGKITDDCVSGAVDLSRTSVAITMPESWVPAVGLTLVPSLGGFMGAYFVRGEGLRWYASLQKPSWHPPRWTLAPIWGTLYSAMGYGSYIVWKELGGFTEDAMVPLGLYTGQLALNWAWPPIFFGARQMGWALADLLLVSGVATATTLAWHRVSPPAARLLYPYLAWLAFATVLNYYVWRDNSGRRGGSRLPE